MYYTMQHIVDEVQDNLLAAGIERPDSAVEYALERAAENWAEDHGGAPISVRELHAWPDRWEEALGMRFGVYDLLEIDYEDGDLSVLTDRLGGEDW